MKPPQTTNGCSSWLLFLSITMMTILLAGTVLSGKLVTFGYSTLQTGATVTFPLAFLISSVVAEVYGYGTSKKLIWFIVICGYLFAFLVEGVLTLPSPPDWNKGVAYQQVLGSGNVLKFTTVGTLGIIVGLFINSYIVTKTKILVHGRHFWLRSLGAVAVGEAAHILVVLFLLHMTTLEKMLATGLTMYVFRMLCVLLFLAPTQVLVTFIKNKEQISYNDYDIVFNPFKFD